jgi:hypothetical protein
MRALLRDRFLMVWLLLVAMTFVTVNAGGLGGPVFANGTVPASAAILVLAFAKVALVMDTYMGLRRAPVALRALCGAWLAIVLALLIITYAGAFR